MLRGAIEYFDGHLLGGWIHSAAGSLRDQTVLAFVDDVCIGAGRIEKFRQDLVDAGFGDGYCGFTFAISPPPGTPRARIVVKLEGSDFALLDRGGRIVDPLNEAARARAADHSVASVEWMRERGWLDASAYDFLKDLTSIVVHDRSLGASAGLLAPATEAKRLLSLYCRAPVRIQEALVDVHNLGAERAALVDGAAVPVIAIHALQGTIRRDEKARDDAGTITTTHHAFHEDRLMFVDARMTFDGDGTATARVFRAV